MVIFCWEIVWGKISKCRVYGNDRKVLGLSEGEAGMMELGRKYKWMTLLGIIAVVYFFLEYIVHLVSPVLVAMLFVTMFGPLLKKIQHKFHVHRQIGAVFILLVFGIVIILLVWLLITWIAGSLPQWVKGLDGIWESLLVSVQKVCDLGSRITGMDTEYLEEELLKRMHEGADYMENHALPGVLSGSVRYVKHLITIGGFVLLFIISTVFLAKDYDKIMNQMLNRQECHLVLDVICGIIRYVATFVKAQLLIMLLIGSICSVVLTLLRIPSGMFWGILAGGLDALPLFGTGIVLVPLAIMQILSGKYLAGVLCLGLYVVCIFTRELLEPRLIGEKMGIPPLVVLATIYAGIQLFGLFGIIKGPLGFILVQQTYLSLQKQGFWEKEGESETPKAVDEQG